MRKLILMAAALAAFTLPAHAEMMKKVSGFAETATIANGYEIKSAELILQHTGNPRVLDFAQMVKRDHEEADRKLQVAVHQSSASNLVFPSSLDAEHNQMMQALISASYQNLDGIYVRQQMNAHDSAITMYEEYARGGDNPTLRQYAMDTLPTLRKHRDALNDIGDLYKTRQP